jgi:hypothetical protein
MPLEATITSCDPIRVPANDPLFSEGDPAVRAALTPTVWCPSNPACPDPGGSDLSSPPPLPEARRQAAYYKSLHQECHGEHKLLIGMGLTSLAKP